MLHCKLLRSPHPHARIAAIDTSRAAAHPGVHLVLTGEDFPIPFGILPVSQDEHALCPEQVRFVGDPVAAVIAQRRADRGRGARPDRRRVRAAARPSPTPEEALAHPEPRIHDYGDARQHPQARGASSSATSTRRSPAPTTCSRTSSSSRATPTCRSSSTPRVAADGSRRQARRSSRSTQTPHYLHRALAQGAGDAGGAHPRDRDAERRRLRRQERSVQPRDRGRQGGADARPAGEDLPHARGGLLLPPRPPPGADAASAPA